MAGKALKAKREFGACAFNATEPWTDSVHTESLYRFRPDDRTTAPRFDYLADISRAFLWIPFSGWNFFSWLEHVHIFLRAVLEVDPKTHVVISIKDSYRI